MDSSREKQTNCGVTNYGEDYFIRGEEKGLSLYTDYRWLPELTIPMAKAIVSHLGIKQGETILDFGCARGYLVRAFREIGVTAWGYDVSQWAVENCDQTVSRFINADGTLDGEYDWIIAKDVLEHIDEVHLPRILGNFELMVTRGIFIVVPLSNMEDHPYVVPQYEKDITHKVRLPLHMWEEHVKCAVNHTWEVRASYRVPGVKDNYYSEFPKGNGFITALR